MNKPKFEIVDLGVEHPDYFQGFGVSRTPFDFCTCGIGDTAEEAYQDALDSMCQNGEHAQKVADDMPSVCPFEGSVDHSDDDEYGDSDFGGPYYHVGIRWNQS